MSSDKIKSVSVVQGDHRRPSSAINKELGREGTKEVEINGGIPVCWRVFIMQHTQYPFFHSQADTSSWADTFSMLTIWKII